MKPNVGIVISFVLLTACVDWVPLTAEGEKVRVANAADRLPVDSVRLGVQHALIRGHGDAARLHSGGGGGATVLHRPYGAGAREARNPAVGADPENGRA